MMKNIMHSDINNICDGYGCHHRAKCKIQVKVGETRTISLSLCESCKTKFNEVDRSNAMIKSCEANSFD
ncbi:MAG: hypothetical protein WBF33_24390 [Candidatus Nitrosopolaris sp.]|jgi:hypothetical protein